MFRIAGRRPPVTLDDVTIERLLDGGAIDDLPDGLRPLGEMLAVATGPPNPEELAGETAAVAAFLTARAAADGPPRRKFSIGVSVFTVLFAAASTGTAVAATRGSLPAPMQQVAHDALGAVGVSVPRSNDSQAPAARRDHVDPSDGSSVTPAKTVATSTSAPIAGSGASDVGTSSPGTRSDAAPGSGGLPAEQPEQPDQPADKGDGKPGDTSGPGNRDPGQDQGGGPKDVLPGKAKKD